MERIKIIRELTGIFNDVLDLENVELKEETCADDIEEWDSLSHIQLIVAIEKSFAIKFTAKEMIMWDNVGDMVNTIMEKLQK
jgi:acyl carrier protein